MQASYTCRFVVQAAPFTGCSMRGAYATPMKMLLLLAFAAVPALALAPAAVAAPLIGRLRIRGECGEKEKGHEHRHRGGIAIAH